MPLKGAVEPARDKDDGRCSAPAEGQRGPVAELPPVPLGALRRAESPTARAQDSHRVSLSLRFCANAYGLFCRAARRHRWRAAERCRSRFRTPPSPGRLEATSSTLYALQGFIAIESPASSVSVPKTFYNLGRGQPPPMRARVLLAAYGSNSGVQPAPSTGAWETPTGQRKPGPVPGRLWYFLFLIISISLPFPTGRHCYAPVQTAQKELEEPGWEISPITTPYCQPLGGLQQLAIAIKAVTFIIKILC